MARPSGPKTRCGGLWTEAKFHGFIKSALRAKSRRWGPNHAVKKAANTKFGFYRCNECKQEVTATVKGPKGKRINNAIVDHIEPIIDPNVGFTTWDECIILNFG